MNDAWPAAEIAVPGAKGATDIFCFELVEADKIAAGSREYESGSPTPSSLPGRF
nr:hypothetical protein [Rhizobium gei]